MNVFELGCLVVPFGVGFFLGRELSQMLGVWGWIIGVPVGIFGSIGLYAIVEIMLGLGREWETEAPTTTKVADNETDDEA